MKRKYGYLLACLALVGALALTSQALGDKGSSGNSKSKTEAVHHSGDDTGNQQAQKRNRRRHRHHAKRLAATKKLEGTVTTVDSGAKTIALALDDSSSSTARTAVVHVPDTAKFATGDKVELFVKRTAADGSFTLVRVDDRRDDVRQSDDGVNHDVGDDRGGDNSGRDSSGSGHGG